MVAMPTSPDLLIAPPTITDKRFTQAVIMLSHSYSGYDFGICVNKLTRYSLQDIIDELGIDTNLNFPLYWGGPVSPGTVWMLHSSEWSTEHTEEINEDWSMTSNIDMFHHLAIHDFPRQFRLMFGYCSWARGQLESEVKGTAPWNPKQSWLVAQNPGPEWLFEHPVDELWDATTELSGQQAVATWL